MNTYASITDSRLNTTHAYTNLDSTTPHIHLKTMEKGETWELNKSDLYVFLNYTCVPSLPSSKITSLLLN